MSLSKCLAYFAPRKHQRAPWKMQHMDRKSFRWSEYLTISKIATAMR